MSTARRPLAAAGVGAAVGGVLLAGLLVLTAEHPRDFGKVVSVIGPVHRGEDGAAGPALEPEETLAQNDVLTTGDEAGAAVRFDGAALYLHARSQAALGHKDHLASIQLRKGAVSVAQRASSNQELQVHARRYALRARGATFEVRADEQTPTVDVWVYAGEVELRSGDAQLRLPAGASWHSDPLTPDWGGDPYGWQRALSALGPDTQ